jgi:adenine-specific DNA-methyltransferase
MVKAYRDTWELGLHSYLSYLRDRLFLARDLLHPSGSIFVQISDENIHNVRELLDDIFGSDNSCSIISFAKTTSATSKLLPTTNDYILWYAKDIGQIKYRQLYADKYLGGEGGSGYTWVELPDGTRRRMTPGERRDPAHVPEQAKIFTLDNLTSQRPPGDFPVELRGKIYRPARGYWKTGEDGIERLKAANRLEPSGNYIRYVRYFSDFPVYPLSNVWDDTSIAGFTSEKLYAVQTTPKVIQRCILISTDPGDLVLDPTCGGGTTPYVAEQWGRRWITIDASRVPLALTRQRLLTATYPWYHLRDETRGPAGGFVYARRRNRNGEEIGGIVPHIMLEQIANNEPPSEELLVDRPETDDKITRITGPFCVEATIPTPVDWDREGDEDASASAEAEDYGSYVDRMLNVLRRSPVLRLSGNKTVTLKNIRPPAKSLALSAEAIVENGAEQPVALLFGPENGAIIERSVSEAAREARGKVYDHLYVIGFAIQANARQLIEQCDVVFGVPATYVQATPDLMLGDLLKTTRSSQIFSVCGMPDIALRRLPREARRAQQYEVELRGLDVFDPVTMNPSHLRGDDVPAWLLDTDYNDLVFHGSQVFFPRTGAWDNLKKALKATHDESVWDHLAGTISAPFEAGEHNRIAVKVIDDRGNELIVVKSLSEAE